MDTPNGRKRSAIEAKLVNFKKQVDKIKVLVVNKESISQSQIIEFQKRYEVALLLLSEFENIQEKIEEEVPIAELSAEFEYREKFESDFYAEISAAEVIISEICPQSNDKSKDISVNGSVHGTSIHSEPITSINIVNDSGIRLPKIELPKFTGEIGQWLEFKDIYEDLIHNRTTLNNVQKLHYLKSTVQGTAKDIVNSVEFSGDNYDIIWKAICDRFNNTRMLVSNYIKQIFNIEVLHKGSAFKLRQISDTLFKNVNILKKLASVENLFETIIIQQVQGKLDVHTLTEFESMKNQTGKNLPTLDEFRDFLKGQADLLDSLEKQRPEKKLDKFKPSKSFLSNNVVCAFCKKDHIIRLCDDFKKLSIPERSKKVKSLKLCFNCLRRGHSIADCRITTTCLKCKRKHHTLLHEDKVNNSIDFKPCSDSDIVVAPNSSQALSSLSSVEVLLPTASGIVTDIKGNFHRVRILLDSGSQSNYMSAECCKKLGLSTKSINMSVTGIGESISHIHSKCSVTIQSIYSNFNTTVPCLVIDQITGNVPRFRIDMSRIKISGNKKLADPEFNKPGKIDILLGSAVFWTLLCIGQESLGAGLPCLQKTRFGWIVAGNLNLSSAMTSTICKFSQLSDIQNQLVRFWEIEQDSSDRSLSSEESNCESHFVQNMCRNSDGRFVVQIPLKNSPILLGNSKNLAEKRLYQLEKRLETNPILKDRYHTFMREYEELGHMSRSESKEGEISYYLPHHGVLKEDSVTTKLRVVFDGSAKSTSGFSVNDLHMVGPTIQQDLFSILVRFRKYPFVFSGDVEKMYRQVLVNENQRSLQRILWRDNPSECIQTYNLNTLTYGTGSASFLAIRCLTQLGFECENTLPHVSRIIKEDFYVDDVLSGADTLAEAQLICKSLQDVLLSGCFKLRKWIANNPNILTNISQTDFHPKLLEFGSDNHTKTLGLYWHFLNDTFKYSISKSNHRFPVTKRIILSETAQIFDPLGLLGPCIIVAKMMLQQLWLEKLTWDESVSVELQTKWTNFRKELSDLNELEINRHVICKNAHTIELHGFCDASQAGYGACLYVRSIDKEGKIFVNLLCAKSRVAPLKPLTIPKLELCGALMLAKLGDQVRRCFNAEFNSCTYWTDSSIVLGWLKTTPNLLKTFVCNRVVEIQDLSQKANWNHITTHTNPADLVSRGVSPVQLKNCALWWQGPPFLSLDKSLWPTTKIKSVNLPEFKVNQVQALHTSTNQTFNIENYSNLNRLVRVVAYCLRFKTNSQKPEQNRQYGPLMPTELKLSTNLLLRLSQKETFSQEIQLLSQGKIIKSNSNVLSLSPFLDNDGLLRVGGRLTYAHYPYNKKHPVLLSGKHKLSKLIFQQEHIRLLHAGPQLLLSSVRERFWILGGRNLCKKTVHQCVRCFRASPKSSHPIMGNLPPSRIEPSPPFHVTGVDYAGPFLIKDRVGRGCKTIKSYLCLYVCFATKAIHLELVTDLSTACFLMSMRRFVSRRGLPSHMYSDNGRNFVGARSELQDLYRFLRENEQAIIDFSTSKGISWHFIPAHSPHFGGLWESGVRSAKFHLKRIAGNALLNFEEMYTLILQIEAILNSRPLCPLSTDPNDLNPLSPAHFLIGRPILTLPDPDVTELPESKLDRFQRVQSLQQHFWRRWQREYIGELQQRIKWRNSKLQLEKDAMVLIRDDNTPPLRWKIGRILDVHSGRDGINRVATILTSSGTIKRSFSKICPLPTPNLDSKVSECSA